MAEQLKKPNNHTQRPSRILVVDDDTMMRNLMYHLLKRYYLVDSVNNAKAAMEILQETEYDLLLLDVMMPGMNGLQLLSYLRAQPEYADLPVIIVTAMGGNDDIVRGLKLGANDYIIKPADTEVVLARVRTQITLKRALDENKQVMRELETVSELRTRLFRIAAHDLKNPLHNISLATNVLHSIAAEVDGVDSVLNNVQESVKTMDSILSAFLDVMAIQTGKLDFKMDELAMDVVVEQVTSQNRIAAYNKNIKLNVHDIHGIFVADFDRMVQIVGNLVSNAIKYSPFNSSIDIWTEEVNGFIRLCVRDQGPGVKEEERGKLFQEFSRTSNQPTGNEHSSGLGLWIIKQLVHHFGGAVGADFPPEGGSIFWVSVPVSEPQQIAQSAC
ncbi:hybrid sensor histidine kinase/response regulator [Phototrophicus methaneseepsis]|uniref:histidine kinase n=1 Tax=Phototrophicus methaneseepsis TaxID=2710758 RepID=A0A7S8EDH2_9CHLR|nr:hybrid sensor histidine kinase/response regulator [Phototrophicus methaneseepsis]QPC84728.1 hybrid sensor histidine kinase/response regulator [Phototrophicus methaneseepsis]